ncbi:MAG: ATP-binding protein [Bacteroidota bacterium]
MISRIGYTNLIQEALQIFPVCAILGPRQCGKTTLAHLISKQFPNSHHFDLEDPDDLEKFSTPKVLLESMKGLIIIDEIQRSPELFPYLRVLVDRNPDIKLLILGSASRDLIHQSSETLAGRIKYIEISPFKLKEVGNVGLLWNRGGLPRSFLATNDSESYAWRKEYITTFLERDLSNMGFRASPRQMRKLWVMLAHYHGNLVNYSDLGRSLGLNYKTIQAHVDILEGAFMLRCLRPWYENIKKRQVKAPKLYIRDSGILHALLDLQHTSIEFHPKAGASWEGFALEEVIFSTSIYADDCYYWRTQTGVELDLMVFQGGKRIGYEFKYSEAPKITSAMHIAMKDLSLDELNIVIPVGTEVYSLDSNIHVRGLSTFAQA